MVLCFFFLGMQVTQALLWREDFPFSKWGMYQDHPGAEGLAIVTIEMDDRRPNIDVLKNPWAATRSFKNAFKIKKIDEWTADEMAETVKSIEEKREALQSRFDRVIAEQVKNPNRDRAILVRVYFKGWTLFKPELRNQADYQALIYERKLGDL